MNWPAESNSQSREIFYRLAPGRLDGALSLAILAAHPDDETLGASYLLAHLPETRVIYLTDGAPRDRRLWSPLVQGSRSDYARIRRAEAEKALVHAGISGQRIACLGGVDQEAIFDARRLTWQLVDRLEACRVDALLTHAYEGGHPDHDAAALIASLALSRLAEEKRPRLLEMTSYHARGGRCVSGEFLDPDTAGEIPFQLSEEDHKRKREMLDEYGSQQLVLANFPLEAERIRRAPAYDFSLPPHAGTLWYESMAWLEGGRWREQALGALREAEERACR